MILVDTSLWVDHLRRGEAALQALLQADRVMSHPFIIGELALGSLRNREVILQSLQDLPQAMCADDEEVMQLIAREKLYGKGIGYIDAHLLASARLSDAKVWTCDKRLAEVAEELALRYRP